MNYLFFPDPGGVNMTWPQAPNVQLTKLCSTTNTSGDNTLVAAPGAGLQHIITSIVLQNESSSATTLILKSGSTAVLRILCQNQGDGLSLTFPPGQGLALGTNAAMILNLSGSNACGYSIQYYTDVI
jgi:hypothetical protein